MQIKDEKYMLFTTYRRNSTPVATPVWVVGLDSGELGFWTSSESGKAKRIAHTPRVTVQACNARGKVTSGEPLEGTARLVTGAELAEIREKVRAKYGAMTGIVRVAAEVISAAKRHRAPYGDRGVVVSLGG